MKTMKRITVFVLLLLVFVPTFALAAIFDETVVFLWGSFHVVERQPGEPGYPDWANGPLVEVQCMPTLTDEGEMQPPVHVWATPDEARYAARLLNAAAFDAEQGP